MVKEARSWIAGLLPVADPLDDLLMIVSELAGNAVKHTRSGAPDGLFTVDLAWSPDAVRLSVGDQGSGEVPALRPRTAQDEDNETGRGLFLVEALSTGWGTVGNADGHWIWADVLWPAVGSPAASPGTSASAGLALATLCRTYPGITAWYGQQTRSWWAGDLGGTQDSLMSAPSLTALSQALAARHLTSCRP
ncbi:MAG TPA: ATP-binding protein [Trebonia sp.]|nr:ATP-binding protein [Trebonia sp.]